MTEAQITSQGPTFTSREEYDSYFKSLDWEGYILEQDKQPFSLYSGSVTVALTQVSLPWGVGALLREKLVAKVEGSVKAEGATLIRLRWWSNTKPIFQDRYRIEITAHDSPIPPLVLALIIVAALAALGFAISAIILASATFKYGPELPKTMTWLVLAIGAVLLVVLIAYIYTRRR